MPTLAPPAACVALLAAAWLLGCTDAPPEPRAPDGPPPIPLETPADSLAARILDATGGRGAWEALPAIRFDFAVERAGGEPPRARRHLWDRRTGRYRMEWPLSGDSLLVALLSVTDVTAGLPAGRVYLDGAPLDSAATRARLEEAYARFINDTYWLLAPLKLFDPGVRRTMAPDSADAATEVLALSFEGVGLTPGDRYWLRADRATGRLVGWTYRLEGGAAGAFHWEEPVALPTPAGPLRLATRKRATDGARSILTPVAPADPAAADFEDPRPRLQPLR